MIFNKKEITTENDTLNLKATCEEEAKEIAMDTLLFISQNCMPINNMKIIEAKKVRDSIGSRNEYEVQVSYEIATKIREDKEIKDKEKKLYYGPKSIPKK